MHARRSREREISHSHTHTETRGRASSRRQRLRDEKPLGEEAATAREELKSREGEREIQHAATYTEKEEQKKCSWHQLCPSFMTKSQPPLCSLLLAIRSPAKGDCKGGEGGRAFLPHTRSVVILSLSLSHASLPLDSLCVTCAVRVVPLTA